MENTLPEADVANAANKPAQFLFRLFAHFIDAAIIGIPGNGLIAIVRNYLGELNTEKAKLLIIISGAMPFLLMIPYFGYCYSQKGTTLGKMILGLQVERYPAGGNLTFLKAALREVIGKSVSLLTLGIGYLMIFFQPEKRALHDLMFESQVRKVAPIRPVLVVAGIFTMIFNYSLTNWNASKMKPVASDEKPAAASTSTVSPAEGN
jgi:uncharacterized RDD family membrane protein YckC